jgi:hypothetical protein
LDWYSLSGGSRPNCSSDIRDVLKKAIREHLLRYNKKEDGDLSELALRIWEAAGEDPDRVIDACNATFRKRAGFGYLFSCLNNASVKPPVPVQVPVEKPPDIPVEKPAAADELAGNYCFFNRSLRNHPYLKTVPAWVRVLWDNLIMDAAWKDHDVQWKGWTITIKRGQWIISETEIALEHGQSRRMVHYWLENLAKQQMIKCDPVFTKGSSKELIYVAASVAGHVAAHVARGTVVTLLNYNKFQARFEDDVAAFVAANVAANVAHTEECIKEGKTEHRKEAERQEKSSITANMVFEIWEKEKGPLEPVRVPRPERLTELVEYLNAIIGRNPSDVWIEIVHRARQCHASHRVFMSPYFFAKDLTHIDQVMNGLYDKSFERGKNGSTKIERAGRGDAEDFGFKGGRRRRINTLDTTEVPNLQ